ncbi:MAG: thioesterase [Schleiferiaceae bacterium]
MSSLEVGKYSATFSPQAHEAAPNNKAFPRTLSNWMQEVARQHAHILGLGVETMISDKKTWLLTRQHVEIDRYPHYGEEIKVTTWPKGFSGLFAHRDFVLTDAEGKTIALATTSWVVLDLNTFRPTKIELPEAFSRFADEHALVENPEKVNPLEGGTTLGEFPVLYSHLDVNRHVNNSQYLNFALDALPAEVLMKREISEWTANFLAECTLGEKLTVFADSSENPEIIEVIGKKGPVFRLGLKTRQ